MIKNKISQYLYKKYNQSFSQCGEDMILAHLLPKRNGVFVDVGAFHPYKFSNTYLFYKRGWRGVNIDAGPGSMNLFNQLRPGDVNIEAAISDEPSTLIYHQIAAGNSMNSFDLENLRKLGQLNNVSKQIPITTKRLDEVLRSVLQLNLSQIDFLSIDVEGFELRVLKSNDWERFSPKIVLIENFKSLQSVYMENFEVSKFLENFGYSLGWISPNALFYVHSSNQLTPTNNTIC